MKQIQVKQSKRTINTSLTKVLMPITVLSIIIATIGAQQPKITIRSNPMPESQEFISENVVYLSYSAYAKARFTNKKAYTGDSSRDNIYSTSLYSYRQRRQSKDRTGAFVKKLASVNSKKRNYKGEGGKPSNYYAYSSSEAIQEQTGDFGYDAVSCDLACTKCVDSVCTECKPHTYMDSTRKECLLVIKPIEGALHYSDTSTASSCEPGYFLSSGSCTKCGDNCSACTSSTVCTVCRLGAVLKSGNTCSIEPACSVSNCQYCSGTETTCAQCQLTFGLVTSECKACNDAKCANCDTNPFECTSCLPGFFLKNNQCLSCTEGCLECDNIFNCRRCDGEFDFMMGTDAKCKYTEGSVLSSQLQSVMLSILVLIFLKD